MEEAAASVISVTQTSPVNLKRKPPHLPEYLNPPAISISNALSLLDELITFEALRMPAGDLEPAGRHSIPVSGVAPLWSKPMPIIQKATGGLG